MAKRPGAKSYISTCQKYSLFMFNFIFWLVGLGCVAFGTYAQLQKSSEVNSALDFLFNPAYLIIVIGAIIFIVAFFGCLGALRENICLLKAYHILLTVVLLLQILSISLVLVFYYVPSIKQQLSFLNPEPVLREAIIKYRDDLDLRDTIDEMQKFFKCCGVSNDDNGFEDWNLNIYFNCTEDSLSAEKCGVPYSCCKDQTACADPTISSTCGILINHQCGYGVRDPGITPASEVSDKIWVKGCVKGFGEFLENNIIIIGGVILGVVIPQIVGICMARNLIDQIKAQLERLRRNR